ncbi:MAG: hypothetical protein R3B06_24035 [Kofleriaceae bacterium]
MAQRPLLLIGAAAVAAACQRQPDGPRLQVLTESGRVRAGDALPATSAIFDGTTVRLRAVRGETVGLEVLREATDQVPVALAIAGATVAGFAVDHAIVAAPSTSMYGPSRGPGTYPDRLIPTDGPIATGRMAYFDVMVPATAAPGVGPGVLTVGARRIPVELTVDAAAVPPLDAAPWVWAYYDPVEVARAAGTTTPAETLAAERPYAALFRRYGVLATPELTLASAEARHDLVAGARFVPVLLPREPAALADAVTRWIARTAGTGVTPFAIPIDEPRTAAAQAEVRRLSALVRAAGGGPGRFLYAVTYRPDPALGDAVDVYVAPEAARDRALARSRAWTYNGAPGWAGAMVVDDAGGSLRSWGWLAFAYDLPLWYVWDALYWRDRHNRGGARAPAHPLGASPITFDDGEDHGALDGVLAYPGPQPSLRLAQLRRGVTDRALLDALAACAGRAAADDLVAPVVPADGPPRWPRDDAGWERLRRQVLDALARCPPARADG